jgi:hypothetical protein
MVALARKENRAAQRRWRERHAAKIYAVQKVKRVLLRQEISDADIEELAGALRERLNNPGIVLLRRALKPVRR